MLEEFGIRPAAALYLSVKDGGVAGVVRAGLETRVNVSGSGVIVAGPAEWERLRRQADERIAGYHREMSAPVILARPRDWECRPCELQGICRIHVQRAKQHA